MRKKSENVQRDLYARLFGATRAAELIATHEAERSGVTSIRVESELYDEIDDVVESVTTEDGATELRGWQIKRQYTDVPLATIGNILRSLAAHTEITVATFAVPAPISVQNGGELRVLAELCRRLSRRGAAVGELLADLRDAEEDWLNALQQELGDASRTDTAARLLRLRIKFIADEETLREQLRDRLEGRFSSPVEPIVAALTEYFASVDGSVEVTYDVLKSVLQAFPRQRPTDFDEVYRVIIDQIENRLWLKDWNNLSDTLVRNLLPTKFVTDVNELSFLMSVQPWPQTRPKLEEEMKNVAGRANSYVDCVMSNHEPRGEMLGENLAYKRRWNHTTYEQGGKRSDEWDQECMRRLSNLVVALNNFAAAVRATVNPRYRMIDGGDFAIVDSLGLRNQMLPVTYHPKHDRPESKLSFVP